MTILKNKYGEKWINRNPHLSVFNVLVKQGAPDAALLS